MSASETETYKQLLEAQQQRVENLRAAGQGARADALAADYHAERMFCLTQDVYAAAAHEGKPPTGYVRGSEHPELLQTMFPDKSLSEIQDFLQPDKSGFRAEIYLPDKSVLGEDAKPVLVFKGTSGKIHDANGTRDTAAEDWLTANLPQGMGLQTDYYDRAMRLAVMLKDSIGDNFEIAGHSLGGGMASAASAVTGMHATTINSAGLHPNTAARYVGNHPGVQLYAAKGRVDAYNVAGDVLTDVQTGVNRMPPGVQKRVNAALSDVVDLLQTPGLRKVVESTLDK